MTEHYGKNMYRITWKNLSIPEYNNTANKIRTAPLWGVRLHSRLMHDGASVTLLDAILRHRGERARHRQIRKAQARRQGSSSRIPALALDH